ncbi:DUF2714 domain-containing protein [Ureaplasma miroungigenitalium]|uniref:DUF2714 domain-containing protein n=1 Tax=Ureaplasma miroungigenitalium TaxID=1042321 RepID=UPI0021E82259|nr:DUF2714 domain-containing protein [Ureaplasma miroungigenitalium]MCV3733986.1 DUF2714 domain-containing protein [Ureaplasma miroungigenitalium]
MIKTKKINNEFKEFQKNRQVEDNKTGLQGIYQRFYDAVQSDQYVSFDALVNTAMLDAQLPYDKTLIQRLKEKINNALKEKNDIVTSFFVISFQKQPNLSLFKTYPVIMNSEGSTRNSVSLKGDVKNSDLNRLLIAFDKLAYQLIVSENKKLELVDEIIVYKHEETKVLKLLFSENFLKNRE